MLLISPPVTEKVIAFIPSSESAELIIDFVRAIQGGRQAKIFVYEVPGETEAQDSPLSFVRELIGEVEPEDLEIESLSSVTPVEDVIQACKSEKAGLLVTNVFQIETFGSAQQTSRELARSSPCRTITAMCGNCAISDTSGILVLANGGPHDLATLRTGVALGESIDTPVSIAILEPDSGTKAERAGERAIRMLLHDASLDEDAYETSVVVGDDRNEGIRRFVEDYDFVISGTDAFNELWDSGADPETKTVMVVKRNPPLRLRSLAEWIPRINPHDHADLLQDLRHGSQWRTDFVAMLGVAAAIASLGMMQNSPAVVIGSMLLAPLMTPMIGLGLAITQANQSMARTCWGSIWHGFLLTLAVSFVIGIVIPDRETLAPEILARGEPNILDLLIAIFAAVAATVAMARPNISGAIAGVAIATALVPPICAIGLSLSRADFGNASGAMLLFATNLVAIIVTCSFTFSTLGISAGASTTYFAKVSRWIRWGLVVLLIVLGGPLSYALVRQLDQGRNQAGVLPVTRAVARAITSHVENDRGIELSFMGRSSINGEVIIQIAADYDVPESYGDELREIVQREMKNPDVKVYVACLSGQWLSRPLVEDEL